MPRESQFLNLLKINQSNFALDALRRPVDRDNFEYGYRVGMVAGYEEAINLLLQHLSEEEYSDNDL
jgi:hypothetical protein|tara:strand:+ start:276 stop:473 length:198 start_codon:yes stop_codon:yes gene_type:complete